MTLIIKLETVNIKTPEKKSFDEFFNFDLPVFLLKSFTWHLVYKSHYTINSLNTESIGTIADVIQLPVSLDNRWRKEVINS